MSGFLRSHPKCLEILIRKKKSELLERDGEDYFDNDGASGAMML